MSTPTFDNQPTINPSSKRWPIPLGLIIGIAALVVLVIAVVRKEKPVSPESAMNTQSAQTQQKDEVKPEPIRYPARFFFAPGSVQASVGTQIELVVQLDTFGKNTVAAQVVLVWDESVLELVSATSDDSVFPMSVMNKQAKGRLEMARAIPGDRDIEDRDDGFTGQGEFMKIVFKPLQAGTTTVSFNADESIIYLDDGAGTGMEMKVEGAQIVINDK